MAKNKNKRNKTNKNNTRTQRTGQAGKPTSEKKSELFDDVGSRPAAEIKDKSFDGVGMKPAELREMIQYWTEHKDDPGEDGEINKTLFRSVEYIRARFAGEDIGNRLRDDAQEHISADSIQRCIIQYDDFDDNPGSGQIADLLNSEAMVKRRGKKLSDSEMAAWGAAAVIAERETQPAYGMSFHKSKDNNANNAMAGVSDEDIMKMMLGNQERQKTEDELQQEQAAQDRSEVTPVVKDISDMTDDDGSDASEKKEKNGDEDKRKAAEAEAAAAGQEGKNPAGWQFGNPNGNQGYANGSSDWNKTMSQLQMLSLMGVVDEKEINKYIVIETVKDIIGRDTTSSSSDAMQSYLTRPGASFADKRLAKKLAASRREYIDMYKGLGDAAAVLGGDIVRKARESGIDTDNFHGSSLLGDTRKNVEKASRRKDRSGPSRSSKPTGAAAGLADEGRGNIQEELGEAIEKNTGNGEPDTEAAEAAYVGTVSQEKDPTCRTIHKGFGAAVAGFGASAASKIQSGIGKMPKFHLPSILSRKPRKDEPQDGKDLPEAPVVPNPAEEQAAAQAQKRDQVQPVPETPEKVQPGTDMPEAVAPKAQDAASELTTAPDVTGVPAQPDPDAIEEMRKNAEAGGEIVENAASKVDAKTEELRESNDKVLEQAEKIAQDGAGDPTPDPVNAPRSTVLQEALAVSNIRAGAGTNDIAKKKQADGPTV